MQHNEEKAAIHLGDLPHVGLVSQNESYDIVAQTPSSYMLYRPFVLSPFALDYAKRMTRQELSSMMVHDPFAKQLDKSKSKREPVRFFCHFVFINTL